MRFPLSTANAGMGEIGGQTPRPRYIGLSSRPSVGRQSLVRAWAGKLALCSRKLYDKAQDDTAVDLSGRRLSRGQYQPPAHRLGRYWGRRTVVLTDERE